MPSLSSGGGGNPGAQVVLYKAGAGRSRQALLWSWRSSERHVLPPEKCRPDNGNPVLVGVWQDKGAAGCCTNPLLEVLKAGLAPCIGNQSCGADSDPRMALGREQGSAEPDRVSKGQKPGFLCREHPL